VSLFKALRYFVGEALINLVRGWKVSLLAILTITVSLLVGGAFLLVSSNLLASVERWRGETRVVLYLQPQTAPEILRRLAAEAAAAPWVAGVDTVTPEAARRRFQESFPSLADLVGGFDRNTGNEGDAGDEPLPASIEVALKDPRQRPPELRAWLESWRRRPEISMVDDDREWLRQIETVATLLRGIGLALAGGLLAAAIFTIASVIRLTAYLHSDEIAVLRLVGATEFYIRGPFYTEGFLQGLVGGGLASGGLWAAYTLLRLRGAGSLFETLLAARFLSPPQLALLVLLGGAAGLAGAVVSLRRESL
jgi:cell division transport system permease protein